MSEKNLKSRIILKHDTQANWEKATGFIPMQGEIIIYDIDENYNYERIKIGDGVRNVNDISFIACSWNDLTDIPFGDYSNTVITWNRNILNEEFHVVVLNMNSNNEWHKRGYYYVSDLTPSDEDLAKGCSVTMGSYEYPFVYTKWFELDNEIYESTNDYTFVGTSVLVVRKDNISIATIDGTKIFPKAGIYFFYEEMKGSLDTYSWYISELKFKGSIKTFDEQLIPSNIARISDVDEVKALIGDTTVSEQIAAAQMVYVGPTKPTDPNIKVWINTTEEGTGVVPVLPRVATISLPANAWIGSGEPYSQIVNIATVTTASKIDLQPSAQQIVDLQNAETSLMIGNDGGVVTCYAIGNKPTVNYTMQVLIQEVAYV